jgi:hypothetical protein
VGSNPTYSTFNVLGRYGITFEFLLGRCRTNLAEIPMQYPSAYSEHAKENQNNSCITATHRLKEEKNERRRRIANQPSIKLIHNHDVGGLFPLHLLASFGELKIFLKISSTTSTLYLWSASFISVMLFS